MTDKKDLLKISVFKATALIPLCLSLAVCAGYPSLFGFVTALIAAVLLNITPETRLYPVLFVFLILNYIGADYGDNGVMICLAAGILISVLFLAIKPLRERIASFGTFGALSLITALFITVIVTNIYFGIGAHGDTIYRMLRSYRSLGFHPNWRGILYGTVVMVVMITFPRKFKKITRIVSGMFFALVITYFLNLLLVPSGAVRTFAEVDAPVWKPAYSFVNLQGDFIDLRRFAVDALISGIALGFVIARAAAGNIKDKKSTAAVYSSAVLSSAFGIPAIFSGNSSKTDYCSGLISALITATVMLPAMLFERLPAASCAVILIVSAWQNLEKKALKSEFKDPVIVIGLIVSALASAFFNPGLAVIILALFSVFGKNKRSETVNA